MPATENGTPVSPEVWDVISNAKRQIAKTTLDMVKT
jgi:hypothetical protein